MLPSATLSITKLLWTGLEQYPVTGTVTLLFILFTVYTYF